MQTHYENLTPAELMMLAKNGDHEAYGTLYNEFFTPVFRYIYRRIEDQETAEDLTQTVFLKVFQSVKNFTDKGISPLAYFFTVARNTIIDFIKKKKEITLTNTENEALEIEIEADISENPNFQMKQKDSQKDLQKALSLLKPDQKEALTLRFLSGLKNYEISRIMKKPEDSIRQLQCRAIKQLKTYTHLKIHL